MAKRIGALILLVAGMWGCSTGPEKPDNLIPEKKYISLLVELQLVRSFAENAQTEIATVDSLSSEVYDRYSVTSEQFIASHNYYQKFPEEQKERVERAIEQLKMDLVTETDSSAARRDTVPPYQ